MKTLGPSLKRTTEEKNLKPIKNIANLFIELIIKKLNFIFYQNSPGWVYTEMVLVQNRLSIADVKGVNESVPDGGQQLCYAHCTG